MVYKRSCIAYYLTSFPIMLLVPGTFVAQKVLQKNFLVDLVCKYFRAYLNVFNLHVSLWTNWTLFESWLNFVTNCMISFCILGYTWVINVCIFSLVYIGNNDFLAGKFIKFVFSIKLMWNCQNRLGKETYLWGMYTRVLVLRVQTFVFIFNSI